MNYLVLARKYRPRSFSQMVGQQHVLQALINALTSQQLHHAYIFAGTRGVGKTTVARIFAKCLNNPSGISADPDLDSDIAKAIDNGQFIDLIEVDAASRTKVEQTRELLENVSYPPTQGRFKIYLIDEAHMLSTSSFNALLKTLEEPPAFVKFLFATTDPQKLPITIVSRCLLFHLRRIPSEIIATQLGNILQQEGVNYDQEALSMLAEAGDGSLRDALSITDQAIAFTNAKLESRDLSQFLGILDASRIEGLLGALLDGNPQEMLIQARQLASYSPNYANLIDQLLECIQKAAVLAFETEKITSPIVQRLADSCTPEVLQLYFQLLLRGKEELRHIANQAMGFEMFMLRLHTFTPATSHAQMQAALGYANASNTSATATPPAVANQTVDKTATKNQPDESTKENEIVKDLPKNNEDWAELFAQLDLAGFARQLAGFCSFSSCDDEGNIVINISKHHREMLTREYHRQIVNAIQQQVQKKITLRYKVVNQEPVDSPLAIQKRLENGDEAIRESVEADPAVQRLLTDFDGEIINVTSTNSDYATLSKSSTTSDQLDGKHVDSMKTSQQ